jgi:hypothetical protein
MAELAALSRRVHRGLLAGGAETRSCRICWGILSGAFAANLSWPYIVGLAVLHTITRDGQPRGVLAGVYAAISSLPAAAGDRDPSGLAETS